jgi:hypothetical protein
MKSGPASRTSSPMGRTGSLEGPMRLLRAAVVSVVAAAAVLLAPGVAAADSVYVHRDCDQFWFWWIPFPCE